MPSTPEEQLKRFSAMSDERVRRSRQSCEEGQAYVKSSRAAIDRSLDLLSKRFAKGCEVYPEAERDDGLGDQT